MATIGVQSFALIRFRSGANAARRAGDSSFPFPLFVWGESTASEVDMHKILPGQGGVDFVCRQYSSYPYVVSVNGGSPINIYSPLNTQRLLAMVGERLVLSARHDFYGRAWDRCWEDVRRLIRAQKPRERCGAHRSKKF